MVLGDIRLLTPAKLQASADFFNLKQTGKRQVFVMCKDITDPRTGERRRLKRSTKTPDLRTAVARAAAWFDDFQLQVQGSRAITLGGGSGFVTLGQLEEHYKRAATCKPIVRAANWNALEAMVAVMAPGVPVASVSTEILDGKFVRLWQMNFKEKAEARFMPKGQPADVEGFERAKRGANSGYRKARSVFSRAMLRCYEDAGLRLPLGIREFATQGFLKAAEPPPSEQLSPEVEAKLWRLYPRLKQVRPGVAAALVLMFRAGLRNSEARMAKWSWVLRATDGSCAIDLRTRGAFISKTRSDEIVDVAPEVIAELDSLRRPEDVGNEDAYLVPADSDFQRELSCYRRLGKFLRACGVKPVKGKLAYRLRGHAITSVWLQHGARAAQAFARHKVARTTEIYRGARLPYAPLGMPGQKGSPVTASPRI